MPTSLPPLLPNAPPAPAPNPKRWTREDCEFLVRSGLLSDRYELIDGEIVTKMGQKRAHVIGVVRLFEWLRGLFGANRVQCQQPIRVAAQESLFTEPEPDLALLSRPVDDFPDEHPGAEDLLLVVEVADTSLEFDLNNKARLYARSGIREYWVADLEGRRIVAHRAPGQEGYRQILEFGESERIGCLAREDAEIEVSALLPQAAEDSV